MLSHCDGADLRLSPGISKVCFNNQRGRPLHGASTSVRVLRPGEEGVALDGAQFFRNTGAARGCGRAWSQGPASNAHFPFANRYTWPDDVASEGRGLSVGTPIVLQFRQLCLFRRCSTECAHILPLKFTFDKATRPGPTWACELAVVVTSIGLRTN